MANRQRGTIKWFNPDKQGYGFIEPDDGGEDIFLHVSEAPTGDLTEGDRLEFRTEETDKGLQAKDVRQVGSRTPRPAPTDLNDTDLRVPRDTAPLLDANRGTTKNFALRIEKAALFKDEQTPDIPNEYSFNRFDENRLQKRHDTHLGVITGRPSVAAETLSAAVDWRLAVGLGRASVYENGITLDPIDGFPYVPGSGVKGRLRSFLINAVYRPKLDDPTAEGKAEEKALKDQGFCDLFGAPDEEEDAYYAEGQRGSVTFHDAYPQPEPVPRVEADIMNPHYQEYYQDTAAPTDDMDPTIITFLTVREATFTFAVSTRQNELVGDGLLLKKTPSEHTGSRLDLVVYWMRRLLTEWGLGAKTAVGYGFFEIVDEPHSSR